MLQIGDRANNQWVDVDQTALDAALKQLPRDAEWNISFLCKDGGKPQDHYNLFDPNHLCVETHKIEKSQTANTEAGGASAANDPNATQHVRVNSPQDLEIVLAAFAKTSVSSTPTPTP